MADVRSIIDRNLIGTMLMCRAVCPGMIARQRGSVINMGSIMAHQGASPEEAYGCVKAAVIHYTRSLALEMRPHGVRVNAVSPGSTDTPGLSNLLASAETGQQRLKMISSTVPLGRLGRPDEIAKAVVFLASDDSSYITGTELFVDGGFAQV